MSEIQNHFGDIILIRRMMVEVKNELLFSIYMIQNIFWKKHKKSCLYEKGKEIIDTYRFALEVGLGVEFKKNYR